MRYFLTTLGAVAIEDDRGRRVDIPAGKPLAVLAYVVLSGTQPDRDALARVFWPTSPPKRARQSVRHALWRLRTALGEELFEVDDPPRVEPGLVETDVDRIRRHVATGELDAALSSYRGRFLSEVQVPDSPLYATWVSELDGEIRGILGHAVHRRALASREAGRIRESLEDMRRALDYEPHNPVHHLTLIETLLDLDRLDEAATAIQQARTAVGEMARDPLAQLIDRHETLVRQATRTRQPVSPGVGLVGRDRELSLIRSAWRSSLEARPRATLVSGEAGMGKRRLVEEASRQVEADGGVVVSVRAREPETDLSWAVAAELVRHLLGLPGAAGISAGSDRLLRSLVPSLSRDPAASGISGYDASLAEAFRDLLSAVAYEAPVLVVLEDAHLADRASLALLHRAVRLLDGADAVLLVLTRRTEPQAPELDRVVRAFDEAGILSRVRLRPLDRRDAATVLESVLVPGSPGAGPPPDPDLVDRLHRLSGGVPLFLFDLLDELARRGHATEVDGRYRLHADAADHLALPRLNRRLLLSRVQSLGAEAEELAIRLAAAGGALDVPAETDVGPEGSEARALDELLDRGVAVRRVDGTVHFAHPLLRESFERRLASAPPRLRRPVLTLGAALALLAGVALAAFALAGPTTSAFGGGTLYLHTVDAVYSVRPAAGERVWRAEPADVPPIPENAEFRGPFRTTGGELLWYRKVRHPEGPYIDQVWRDGRARTIIRNPGDDNIGEPSPDGRFIVYRTENLETERYDQVAYVARADGTEPRRIYTHQESLGALNWSPDGRRISMVIRARPDTLAVITPGGERVHSFTFHSVNWTDWCGGSRWIAAHIRHQGRPQVVLLDVESDSVRVLGPGRAPECSPDGRAVAYVGLIDGAMIPIVQDIRTGQVTRISVPGEDEERVRLMEWVPDRLPPAPVAVQAVEPTEPIYRGDRVQLRAVLEYSDARTEAAPVAWRSLDPARAYVSGEGLLYPNRAGAVRVVASYDDWLTDTLDLRIEAGGPQHPLLADPLTSLDPERWTVLGDPPPIVIRDSAIGPVLSLRGDGRYTDGIITRVPFPIGRGVTVELEFLLSLTRPLQQRIGMTLTDAGAIDRLPAHTDRVVEGESVGVAYPADELLKFDPSAIVMSFANGYNQEIRLPDALPTDDWVHVALQVDASGAALLMVDRKPVMAADIRLDIDPDDRWVLHIDGAAVETRLLVRNLVIWEGTRWPEG